MRRRGARTSGAVRDAGLEPDAEHRAGRTRGAGTDDGRAGRSIQGKQLSVARDRLTRLCDARGMVRSSRRRRVAIALLALGAGAAACGGARDTDASRDLEDVVDGYTPDVDGESAPQSLRICQTTARMDGCFVVTPAESGLRPDGVGAQVDQYALRPGPTTPRHTLLVFLNGSGGTPRGVIANPDVNWYRTARDAGLHVLGVSYRSDDAVGLLCAGVGGDACFVPTRQTLLTGMFQPGAASALTGITPDEGVYARVTAALVTLAGGDPAGGWGDYLDRAHMDTPESAIRWDRVMVSGHSQGGGHAALIGRNHAVARVLMLASPCDATSSGPATWLANDGSFATDPATRFYGLGASGDSTCAMYARAWANLGMPAIARQSDAVACAGETPHAAPLRCIENETRWAAMLQ